MARQRLAPMKQQENNITIPRLELLALLCGIRLTSFVLTELPIQIRNIYLYSDSQVTLHWIQSNAKNGVFVANRLKEIKETLTIWKQQEKVAHLRYIRTEHNPADCATRGLNQEEIKNHVWWTGPPFLCTRDLNPFVQQEFQWDTKEEEGEQDERAPKQSQQALTTQSTEPSQ